MLRRKFFIFIFFISAPFAILANDATSVDTFRRLIEVATQGTVSNSEPYFNKRMNQWAKRKFIISDLKYDVKRTDSLVNPIIGSVTFRLTTTQTSLVATKEEAEQSTSYNPRSESTFNIRLNYTHKDGLWGLRDGDYEVDGRSGKYELTPAKIQAEPTSIPHAALHNWLQDR